MTRKNNLKLSESPAVVPRNVYDLVPEEAFLIFDMRVHGVYLRKICHYGLIDYITVEKQIILYV